MAELHYLDFDLCIEKIEGGYRAEVLRSPAGEARAEFALPFSELELENFLLRFGGYRRTMRGIDSAELEAAKKFGGRLFDAVFINAVRDCLTLSLSKAADQGHGLRLRLRLSEAIGVADLPWEFLYNPDSQRFLVLSNKTPLVRYLDLPGTPRTLQVTPPLRVLVMISSPADYPPLDVAREWANLQAALGELVRCRLVALERLEEATLAALQDRLRERDYHMLHFIGHGTFNDQTRDGLLVLEDEAGKGRLVSGQYFGTILHDHDPLRLVVLNACEGARSSAVDPLAGTAQSLVRQGIPAVIAMQFEVSDTAAIVFARSFYGAIADRYPVDAALAEARKTIFGEGNTVEWGTPVLYLRAPDGRIFDLMPLAPDAPIPTPVPALTTSEEQPGGEATAATMALPADEIRRAAAPPAPRRAAHLSLSALGCQLRLIVPVVAALVLMVSVGQYLARGAGSAGAPWPGQPDTGVLPQPDEGAAAASPTSPPTVVASTDQPGATPSDEAIRLLFLQNPALVGDDVRRVQGRLAELGYLPPEDVIGRFGPRTDRAVRQFQQLNGLEIDGVVGPQTWAALLSPSAVPFDPAALSSPVPSPAGSPPAEQGQGTTPACVDQLGPSFERLFKEDVGVRERLDCPIAPETSAEAVVQRYSNGTMLWWAASDTIYVLLGEGSGKYQVYDSAQTAALPAAPPAKSSNDPIRGFGRIYFGVPEVRQALGASLSPEVQLDGVSNPAVTRQEFRGGLLVYRPAEEARPARIFVLYNDGTFVRYDAPGGS